MSENITYLLVDDEQEYQDKLQAELKMSPWGTEYITAASGEEAKEKVEEAKQKGKKIDLVVLDLYFGPDKMYGIEVLKWFSDNTEIPVVILSTNDSSERKIQAYNLGAVAYLDKFRESKSTDDVHGFDLSQIRRYLEGYHRRRSQSKIKTLSYSFIGWILEPDRQRLYDPTGSTVKLSKLEFDLLLKLVEKPRVVLTSEELIIELAMCTSKDPKNALNQKISRLRRKLRDKAKEIIVNSYSGGFYFAPDVKTITS